ncbi:MFS transporter [Pandoraea oxalativorans]|uniref:Major facilitator superfamily (MFS) profile domain-containing protein n=1 Tax=Pandoraea oxalativorans TaxID=573737 RepID=A0A0E3YBV6_9BURK|nr:MFS transporter [Pandoraea oxalativorans]AKC69457.1 hypothetical protein MB84_08140 [Pandoraea oxalativorans]
MTLPYGLRALSYANFRRFIAGQGCAQIGNWQQLITTSWLAYTLSGSTLLVGVAAFALQIPMLLVAPLAGPMLDRFEARRILLMTNTVACVQSLAMLSLLWLDVMDVWHIVAGNLVLGIINAIDAPGRQALVSEMVDRADDLPNAIALNSIMMSAARFIGPMLAGYTIGWFGHVGAFCANATLRVAVIAALGAVRTIAAVRPVLSVSWWHSFAQGLNHARAYVPCRNGLLLLACLSFTIQTHASLMPWFVRERFHADAAALGNLMGMAGLGALAGLAYLATRRGLAGLIRAAMHSSIVAALATLGLCVAPGIGFAMAMLFLIGMGTILTSASINTVLQLTAPSGMRARIATLYVVAFMGVSPLGALFWGWVAAYLSAPIALAICGIGYLMASLAYRTGLPRMSAAVLQEN